jgi:hypothetical protein
MVISSERGGEEIRNAVGCEKRERLKAVSREKKRKC